MKRHRIHISQSLRSALLIQSSLLFAALFLGLKTQPAHCEAKEFDWSELGVSLSSPKSSSGSANNLRILVSPQRRSTKSSEYDYSNNSQPTSSQGEPSYVIPGSSSSYGSQSANHASHSSAYSALSASIASLKNRLSSRGVNLSSPGSEAGSQQSPNYYQTSGNSYSLSDSQQQAQNGQTQSQPTYLSMTTNQQDPQSSGGYATQSQNNNDNKTIVLAIPAKINFLTDGRSSAGTKQQPQQVTVIQPTSEQQSRNEYSSKQLGLINTQDGSAVDPTAQMVARDPSVNQEHQQYVIVNSPTSSNDASQLLASTGITQNSHYTSVYPSNQQGSMNSYSMKYIPAYQQNSAPQQAISKLYSQSEQATSDSSLSNEQGSTLGKYASCLDTCNWLDPRWRKFTFSKYKYCCSRSSQYDSQFDQPSADKTSESSNKYTDDAYYSYLYRKTRARRSRKPHRSSRHSSRYTSPASSLNADEDNPIGESGGSESSRPSTSGRSSHNEYPYMKYYRNRQQSSEPSDGRDGLEVSSGTGKFSKDRSYRRSRSRDFEVSEAPSAHDFNDDDSSFSPPEAVRSSSGYGSSDYPASENGRFSVDSQSLNDEDETRSGFEDVPESERDSGKVGAGEVSVDYSNEPSNDSTNEEGEPETTTSYKSLFRRKKHAKNRSRKSPKDSSNALGRRRKSRKGRFNKYDSSSSQQQNNGTDFEQQLDHIFQTSNNANEEDQSNHKDSENGDVEKDVIASLTNRYKQSLNETTVANLSKTTMHLKEILSILEKKAQLRVNESQSTVQSNQPTPTSTPPPTTTTILNPSQIYSSQYSSPSLQTAFSNDYITPDLGLKSPYRFESSSLSPSLSSSSLSLPSTFGSLGSDSYTSLAGYGSNGYGLPQTKHFSLTNGHHPRKRRVNKNLRYNNLMMHKSPGIGSSLSLPHSTKNSYMSPAYYSLQYPYWYSRGTSSPTTNSYPYKNFHKSPYSSLMNNQGTKMSTGGGGFYSDESRLHSIGNYDPIATVASSLRPSTTMRLRSKPYMFQPQVLPIYTRHTLLTSPMDVKK